MTRTRGVRIVAAPCCGARYVLPNYLSMNFSAFEYWTDGWRYGSLMPNDEGIRRCKCGALVMTKDLVQLETAATSDLPLIANVLDEELPECIAKATGEEMELAARLQYWRYLNHPYRQLYRQHREAEEAMAKAAWEAAHPDPRTLWDKLCRRKAPRYVRPTNSPCTIPPFEANAEQTKNMARLSDMFQDWAAEARGCDGYLMLAELYREQGRIEEARTAIAKIADQDKGVESDLLVKLIDKEEVAPVRFRL